MDRARKPRPSAPLLVGLVLLAGWLLPGSAAQVSPSTESLSLCRVCESYTQGGETYWHCPTRTSGSDVCKSLATSCVESGACDSGGMPAEWILGLPSGG